MKIFLRSTFFLLLFAFTFARAQQVGVNIVPAPNNITYRTGSFTFSNKTKIYADRSEMATKFLIAHLKESKGYQNTVLPSVNRSGSVVNAVVIEKTKIGELPAEAYELIVSSKQVKIRGRDAGLLYGVYSFLQLFPAQNSTTAALPGLEIKDAPRFGHRGMMLDVARHFFTVKEVKKLLDLMAFYKLNTFHWHLTDSEGWRIQIKKYPKLTAVGAFRNNQVMFGRRELLDTLSYGGYYTQEDIKEVVRYAADRFITIIPEIDIPAHSHAALRAYPELRTKMPEKSADPGAYDIIYNPSEETFKFLEGVFTEVAALFPGRYIHIGGDEANKTPWKEASFTQAMIREKDLKDVHGLQSYFIKRIEKFLNSLGKQIIGWDEILEGGLAPNATVMSWRNENGGIESAQMNHNVIMVPLNKGLYFDFGQSTSPQEPFNIGGYAPLGAAYSYDPIPKAVPEDKKKYIIGVQANLWTEFIGTFAKVEYMIFPRMLALSEISWTQLEKKNYQRFSKSTLPVQLAMLEKKQVNFRVPEAFSAIDTTMMGESFQIELKHPIPGSKIYYTVNGLNPGPLDFEYTKPLSFSLPPNEKREIKAIVITATGKRSLINTIIAHNRPPSPAVQIQQPSGGLSYRLVEGAFHTVDKIEEAKVIDSGIAKDLALNSFKKKHDVFGVIYEGYISVEATGVYNFSVVADDGMKLFIDEELVVNNDQRHAAIERSGSIPLTKGFHKIKIKYFDAGEAGVLKVSMKLDNEPMAPLKLNQLFHVSDAK